MPELRGGWKVEGEITPPAQLASIMLELQARGCNNIQPGPACAYGAADP